LFPVHLSRGHVRLRWERMCREAATQLRSVAHRTGASHHAPVFLMSLKRWINAALRDQLIYWVYRFFDFTLYTTSISLAE